MGSQLMCLLPLIVTSDPDRARRTPFHRPGPQLLLGSAHTLCRWPVSPSPLSLLSLNYGTSDTQTHHGPQVPPRTGPAHLALSIHSPLLCAHRTAGTLPSVLLNHNAELFPASRLLCIYCFLPSPLLSVWRAYGCRGRSPNITEGSLADKGPA